MHSTTNYTPKAAKTWKLIRYFILKNHPTRKYPETRLGDKMTKLSKPFLKAHVSVWANQPYKTEKAYSTSNCISLSRTTTRQIPFLRHEI